MTERTDLYSTNFLSSEYETVYFQGCSFRVYRKRASSKVFTVSFWKSKAGYVFNLAHSLFWWAENLPLLYPDYNIRLYFDNSVFSTKEDSTEWIEIMRKLLRFPHLELWFFYCAWGADKKCIGCHKGTFGSLIRFHAFDDPETEVVLCRNLEYLSSPRDAERTKKWIASGKPYHWYCYWNEYNQYGCVICPSYQKKGITIEPNMMTTIMATFSYQKERGQTMEVLGDRMIEFLHRREHKEFIYGIDEYVLTLRLKGEMTLKNTFITDFINDVDSLVLVDAGFTIDLARKFNHISLSDMSTIFQTDPYKGAEIIRKAKKFLNQKLTIIKDKEKILDDIQKEFHAFLFKNFKEDRTGFGHDIHRAFFRELEEVLTKRYKEPKIYIQHLIYLSILENSIFNCIDFPGFCVKTKDFGSPKKVDKSFDQLARKIYNMEPYEDEPEEKEPSHRYALRSRGSVSLADGIWD